MNRQYYIEEYKGEKGIGFCDEFGDSVYMPIETIIRYIERLEKELNEEKKNKNHRIKVLERAFENLAKSCEKESCYYCPCGYCGEDRCNFGDDSEECIAIIKEHFIAQAEKEIKDERI